MVPTLWVKWCGRGAREPCRLARVGPYPQRIILDRDDIEDPSSNSPWCAGDSHYCAERALVLPGTMCRDYKGTDVRLIITNPRRARQGALQEVFWSAWTRSPACSRWQANQLPAHRHLLAAAQLDGKCSRRLEPPSRRSGARS